MKKAIFLDRDGVINADQLDYTWKISDFRILEGVYEACLEFVRRGYLLIVITNQGGIAKGLYTHEDVHRLHDYMRAGFIRHGLEITEVYYCPHHDSTGKCLCRKPGSLLVEKALARFNVDPASSFFIGDRDRDIQAAAGAGVKGILVPVNDDLRKTLPIIS
jgi:D-glycero-D-manno-heptose 1,7-bisphosphate phosphatase